MSNTLDEVLNGWKEIREFWDPYMSEYYFNKHIKKLLIDTVVFKRRYVNTTRYTSNIPVYYTYKALLISFKIKQENMKK
jgi:hypothetical protein